MMKHASRAEVAQVAETMFSPMLENVHQDVANVRAELVAEGRARLDQDQRIAQVLKDQQQLVGILKSELAKIRSQEKTWQKMRDEAKSVRQQNKDAIRELQKTQSKMRAEIARLAAQVKILMARIAEDDG